MTQKKSRTIKLFYCYARKDEKLRDELDKHLKLLERQGILRGWYDCELRGGDTLDDKIHHHLSTADIILLLVSPDFMASDYIWEKELDIAMERHARGEARVIPVILRPVDWIDTVFGKLLALPKSGKPVIKWPSLDEAFLDVARGIRRVIEALRASRK